MKPGLHIVLGASLLALAACGADAAKPDAGDDSPDARRPRPDARPFVQTDAAPQPDAAPDCSDDSEPNNTSALATSLSATPISANDSSGGNFTGAVINADLDWFEYTGDDDIYAPDAYVDILGGVEVCMYLSCAGITFTCPNGTTTSTDGSLEGCCGNSAFTVVPDCDGLSDDAQVFMRVKALAADTCEAYTITYHY